MSGMRNMNSTLFSTLWTCFHNKSRCSQSTEPSISKTGFYSINEFHFIARFARQFARALSPSFTLIIAQHVRQNRLGGFEKSARPRSCLSLIEKHCFEITSVVGNLFKVRSQVESFEIFFSSSTSSVFRSTDLMEELLPEKRGFVKKRCGVTCGTTPISRP